MRLRGAEEFREVAVSHGRAPGLGGGDARDAVRYARLRDGVDEFEDLV